MVFMTNVPEGLIRNKDAGDLYQRRWGIESSFKDITSTLKLCQWHSQKLNGILQEIYALLWLVNNVRRLMSAHYVPGCQILERRYQKSNFKLVITLLLDHLNLLIKQKYRTFLKILNYWIKRSLETRKHLSRSYPRQIKRFGKKYVNASRVSRRRAP